jgi:hypothetical protein
MLTWFLLLSAFWHDVLCVQEAGLLSRKTSAMKCAQRQGYHDTVNLFICGSFNDAVCSIDYMASDDRLITE